MSAYQAFAVSGTNTVSFGIEFRDADVRDLLAFGIGDVFKQLLKDKTTASHIAFFLLEKEDKPNPRSKTAFVGLNAVNNVYKAWGSFLREPLYRWAKETNAPCRRHLRVRD